MIGRSILPLLDFKYLAARLALKHFLLLKKEPPDMSAKLLIRFMSYKKFEQLKVFPARKSRLATVPHTLLRSVPPLLLISETVSSAFPFCLQLMHSQLDLTAHSLRLLLRR